MKKFLRSAIVALACAALTVPAFAAPEDGYSFSDIMEPNYEWAAPDIEAMYKRGFISGYGDGTYRPDNDVTRLECITLFARAMGSSDPVNAPLLDMARQLYGVQLGEYELSWGGDAVAYMMYKGVLDWDDVNLYLAGNAKNEPMKRYEAAVIITKAMGGEGEALSDLGAVLDYTDSDQIPSDAFQYVAYISEKGIMNGMSDGSFSPQTAVKRSQVAVMLANTVNHMGYTYVQAKISGVDTARMMISTINSEYITNVYSYDEMTTARSGGQKIQLGLLPSDMDAIFTISNDILVAVDVISALSVSNTITGAYQGSENGTDRIYVQIILNGETEVKTYACDVSMQDAVAGLSIGETVTAEISNGIIVRINAGNIIAPTQRIVIEGATVTSINGNVMTIAHSNAAYNAKGFNISSGVTVTKNTVVSTLNDVQAGDIVNLTISGGLISVIDAKSPSTIVSGGSGTIKQIIIAELPSITISIGGQNRTYGFTQYPSFTRNGQAAEIYDFRLNENVTIGLDGQSIASMELIGEYVPPATEPPAIEQPVPEPTEQPQENLPQQQPVINASDGITGTVTIINSAYGLVMLQTEDGVVVRALCQEDTIFMTEDGVVKTAADIQVGKVITIYGTQAAENAYKVTQVIIQD